MGEKEYDNYYNNIFTILLFLFIICFVCLTIFINLSENFIEYCCCCTKEQPIHYGEYIDIDRDNIENLDELETKFVSLIKIKT